MFLRAHSQCDCAVVYFVRTVERTGSIEPFAAALAAMSHCPVDGLLEADLKRIPRQEADLCVQAIGLGLHNSRIICWPRPCAQAQQRLSALLACDDLQDGSNRNSFS